MSRKDLKHPLNSVNWGDLRTQEPLCRWWGLQRGQPIDRFYIERFLKQHATDIKGHCLEIFNDNYIQKFSNHLTKSIDVLDIDEGNSNATIFGDLAKAKTLPKNTFDCFILTQTLSHIYDAQAALKNSYTSLKRDGVLLISVPALCRYSPQPKDFWRFTSDSLSEMIQTETDCQNWKVSTQGNLVTSIGFLMGLCSQELEAEEFEHYDEHYPITVTARLVRN